MGKRISLDTYEALLASNRMKLIAGLTQGKENFYDTIRDIVSLSVTFGHDEFDRPDAERTAPVVTVKFPTTRDGLDELFDVAVETSLDMLFNGTGVKRIVDNATLFGIAWGTKKRKAETEAEAAGK